MIKTENWKCCVFLLFYCLFTMQSVLAQELAHKRMSIDKTNVSLEEILNDIKKKTGYNIFYNTSLLKGIRVTVKKNNATVDAILKDAFHETNLTYRLENDTIVVREKSVEASNKRDEARNGRLIRGKVVDQNGEALAGSVIRVVDTMIGTVTDVDGLFSIKVPSQESLLEVSFIGMETKQLKQTQKDYYKIMLSESSVMLGEVVATGYQTMSRERVTGSYKILKGEDVRKRHTTNFSKIMDGLVAGLQGTDDGRGGLAYQIRGTGTMLADKQPLVVVDGFPLMDRNSAEGGKDVVLSALEKINPNDVENITILKDAAAASIWGARSANGVIVITTKQGGRKKNWEVSVNSQLSIGQKRNVNYLMNSSTSEEMINYQRMAFERNWILSEYYGSIGELTQPVTASELLFYKNRRGEISEDEMNRELDKLAKLDNKEQIKKYFLKSPLVYQTNASFSGGGEKYGTHASILYQHDTGDFIGDLGNLFMANWNNQFELNKRISIQVGLNLQQNNLHASYITDSDVRNLSPYEMLFNPDGSYASHVGYYNTDVLNMYDWTKFPYQDMNYNVLQEARTRRQRTTNTSYRVQTGLQFNILQGLQFNTKFQYEENRYKQRAFHDEESFFTRYRVNYYTPGDFDGNALGESILPKGGIRNNSFGKRTGIVFRNDISLDRVFGSDFMVSGVLGNELSNYKSNSYVKPTLYGASSFSKGGVMGEFGSFETMTGSTSTIDGVPAEGEKYVSELHNYNRYVSFYGNASVTYRERYGLSLSARSDASNLITSKPKYRWSPLWSAGLLWNMTNENFMENNGWIDRLTFRLTYGQNGNAYSASSARTTINTQTGRPDGSTGLYPGAISDYGNPTLRWERTATTNFGVDFSFLDHHLYGSVDLYNKKGTDILGDVAISSVNGTSNVVFNNAEILNRGIEIALGAMANMGEVRLSANINYAYNKNKITKLYNELPTVTDVLNATYVQGKPLSPIFTFEYLGVNEEGIPTVSDGKGGSYPIDDFAVWYDPNINLLKYLGTRISPHTLGFNLGVNYKNFDLSAFFSGRLGGKISMPVFNYPTIDSWSKMQLSAQIRDVLQNSPDRMPLPSVDVIPEKYTYWSFFHNTLDTGIEDASYIYCKEIILNYDFPGFVADSSLLKGLSLFAKAENLGLIWSANSRHYHPDYLPGEMTPPVFTCTLGVHVDF